MTIDPSHDEISQRAYSLWEQRGRPEGQDSDNWLDAERELRARSGASATSTSDSSRPSGGSASPLEKARRSQRRESEAGPSRPAYPDSPGPVRAPRDRLNA